MNKVMGGSLPAEIWHDIMAVGHEGRAPLALPGFSPSPAQPQTHLTAASPPSAKPAQRPAYAVAAQPNAPAAASSQAATTPSQRHMAQPVLPRERIDENFIARALEAESRAAAPAVAAAPTADQAPPAPVKRPFGLMSLGR